MQRIYNYGSFLQAYALKKMMEECGAEVEFVDYHPGECILPSKETTGMKRKIQKEGNIKWQRLISYQDF